VHADIENDRCLHVANNRFTNVVLPEPEGAVITIILLLSKKLKINTRIKEKSTAFSN
jgi:hypothetical protein